MKHLEWIEPLTTEMLENMARLVAYNSVKGPAVQGKPFGEVPAACLAEALQIAQELGFKTTNMDNYCGYAEMGEGDEIIGIAAHLDIVPAGDGWVTDPFTLTEKDGVVYGRGVSDDKGALIASLYAMKLVQESGIPLNKRVRLLMGCDEESGSECMKYYVKHGEPITTGFTPDGNFPGIHGEKGGCGMVAYSKNTKIISMNGGFVANAVCNQCTTEVPADAVDADALKAALAETPLVSASVTTDGDKLVIHAQGVAAHASTPLLGVNAAAYTMQALQKAGMQDDFVDFYMSHLGVDCDGAGIGLKIRDQYGELTFNNGIVKTTEDGIFCTIDIRYPVTYTPDQIRALA
ncbi:MAG: Sapep family Mn(2+)-dependent dipeptidase, partial [Firmicutes bacterium]|nr:Sapep family Mn(2+)-dependent dipeptidase [Bacillota bacterium]